MDILSLASTINGETSPKVAELFVADDEDEHADYQGTFTFDNHLLSNLQHYKSMMLKPNAKRHTLPGLPTGRSFISPPSASGIPSKCANPALYMMLDDLDTIDELAVVLGVTDPNWREKCNEACGARDVVRMWNSL